MSQTLRITLPTAVAIAIGACAGVGLSFLGAERDTLLLLLLVLVLVAPLAVRAAQARVDVLEPVAVFAGLMLLVVASRLGVALTEQSVYWRGFFVDDGLALAISVAVLGSASWVLGYEAISFRRVRASSIGLPDPSPSLLAWGAIGMTAVGVLAFSVFLAQTGEGLGWFTTGRATVDTQYRSSVGYLYDAPLLLVPTALVAYELWRSGRRWLPPILFVVWAPFLIGSFFHGQRLALVALGASLAAYAFLRSGKRPSLLAILVIGLLLLVPFAALREARVADSARDSGEAFREALTSPGESVKSVTLGTDLEAADALMFLVRYVEAHGYEEGSVLTSLLAAPIPRTFWSGKPVIPEERITASVFPADYSRSRAGATYTALGSLYFDSGLIGVTLGMALVGAAFRALWDLATDRASIVGAGIAALVPVLMFAFVRGSVYPLVLYAVILAAPLLLLGVIQRWLSQPEPDL